jgi:hypothetical protein
MDMIRLDGKMHEPHPEALPRSSEDGEHDSRERLVSQAGQPGPQLHRDVRRMARRELRPPQV